MKIYDRRERDDRHFRNIGKETLQEVYENVESHYRRGSIGGTDYFTLTSLLYDAIHNAPSCEIQQYAESCADCGFCNAPLTLDELRGMDGEPVYLQFGDGVCGWAIVLIDGDWITFECPDFDGHCEPDVDFINMEYNDPDGHFGLHILGWRALRRKPEPGKEEPT